MLVSINRKSPSCICLVDFNESHDQAFGLVGAQNGFEYMSTNKELKKGQPIMI
jgi:hypothetical protein